MNSYTSLGGHDRLLWLGSDQRNVYDEESQHESVSAIPATKLPVSATTPAAEESSTLRLCPSEPPNEDLGSWVLTVFLTMIPLVNIVDLLVLAFGDNTSIAKANFARATLIWTAVGIAVSIIFAVLLATAGVSIINEVLNEHSNEFNH